MSYVHCHACGWSQDDFWNRSYNPAKYFFIQDIPTWIKPEMVKLDPCCMPKSPIPWMLGLAEVREVPWVQPKGGPKCVDANGEEPTTVREYSVFSWVVLGQHFVSSCRSLFTQKWWTYASWKKALKEGKGGCPKCGDDLCID
jgi:hypothetical protein